MERAAEKFLHDREAAGLKRALCAHQAGIVDFSHNDYLGLSQHPALAERTIAYLNTYGAGACASRVLNGNRPYHTQLEDDIAQVYAPKKALIFASGFQANATVISALVSQNLHGGRPLVLADRDCHNSMLTGCQLGGARVYRYPHQSLVHLETLLQQAKTGPKFILTETVFSMTGTVTDIAAVVSLAKRYGAYTIFDDAHGIGVFGENGYGTVHPHIQDIDVVIGTFSKALGSFGAYCVCSTVLRDYLLNTCRGFIYTTAPSPPMVGAMQAAWTLLPKLTDARTRLFATAAQIRDICTAAGWTCGQTNSPIIPVYDCHPHTVLQAHQHLCGQGILASYVRPPTTPAPMLRFAASARHTQQDLDQLRAALNAG